jgi:hypothetical protein
MLTRGAGAARFIARRWLPLTLIAVLAGLGAAAPWWLHRLRAAPAPASAPAGLPLVRHLAFTWLPAGYRTWAYSLDANRETLAAAANPGAQVDQNLSAQVTAYPAGVTPPPDYRDALSPWVDATAAQRVGGAPTQWARLDPDVRVRWRYSRDAWAVLEFTGPAGPDNLATALRVAAGTRFDEDTEVRLPVALPDLPRRMRLRAVDSHQPGPPDQWALTLTFAPAGRPLDPNAPYPALVVDVQAMNDDLRTEMADPQSGRNTTVDGHPARRDRQPQPGDAFQDQLRVWDVDGLRIAVQITGDQTRRLLGADAVAVYHRLRISQE